MDILFTVVGVVVGIVVTALAITAIYARLEEKAASQEDTEYAYRTRASGFYKWPEQHNGKRGEL
jgi:hypothetical protein